MIMTEPNVIDMCDVYEPRVPRERPRDRGEQPGTWTLLHPRVVCSLPTRCTSTSGRLTLVLDNVNPEVELGVHLFQTSYDLHGDETPDVVEDSHEARRRMNFLSPFFPSSFFFSFLEPNRMDE